MQFYYVKSIPKRFIIRLKDIFTLKPTYVAAYFSNSHLLYTLYENIKPELFLFFQGVWKEGDCCNF